MRPKNNSALIALRINKPTEKISMRRIAAFVLTLFISTITALRLDAQAWPPAQAKMDTMNMRMAVLKGMPDSVVRNNPLVLVDKIDEDEHDLYMLDKYMKTVTVMASMLSSDPDVRGRSKAYAKVSLLNDKGEEVKSVTTDQGGWGTFRLEELGLPDGIYRIRVDYGSKHTKDGTKPKTRTALRVYPSVSGNSSMRVSHRH